MDFATEDWLRDRAYNIWRELSIEPIAVMDVQSAPTAASVERWSFSRPSMSQPRVDDDLQPGIGRLI